MEVLAALQGVLNLAQGVNNTKLTQEIINLQQSILTVVIENNEFLKVNLKLQAEIDELKLKLEIKDKVEFKEDFYWLDNDGPYCVSCYDTHKKLCRIVKDHLHNTMKCPSCNYTYKTKEQKQQYIESLSKLY